MYCQCFNASKCAIKMTKLSYAFSHQSNLYFANAEIFRSSLYTNTLNPRKLLKFLKKREAKYEQETRQRLAQGLAPEQRRNSVGMLILD